MEREEDVELARRLMTGDATSGRGSSAVRNVLDHAISALPENYRSVVLMWDVEELSTAETAESLDLTGCPPCIEFGESLRKNRGTLP